MTPQERKAMGMEGPSRGLEREAKVIKFLLNHPESTANEVWIATKCGVMNNPRFLIQKRHEKTGQIHWSVNELKYRHFLRTGNIAGRARQ